MIGIYKYVDKETNEVVYVGKAVNVQKRHYEHVHSGDVSEWFGEKGYEVYTIETNNRTDADILETAMINYYKPKYNKFKMYGDVQTVIDLDSILQKWKLYKPKYKKREQIKKIAERRKMCPIEDVVEYLESLKGKHLFKDQKQEVQQKLYDFGFRYRFFGMKTINKICSDNGIPLTVSSYQESRSRTNHRHERYWIIEDTPTQIA